MILEVSFRQARPFSLVESSHIRQIFCIVLFVAGATLFGLILAQLNEILMTATMERSPFTSTSPFDN
jgi:hypothetical protein